MSSYQQNFQNSSSLNQKQAVALAKVEYRAGSEQVDNVSIKKKPIFPSEQPAASHIQSKLFSEYEVRKDSEELPRQNLFHQYIQPVADQSSQKKDFQRKVKTEDAPKIKSEFTSEALKHSSYMKSSPESLRDQKLEIKIFSVPSIKSESCSDDTQSPTVFEQNKPDSDPIKFDKSISTPTKTKREKKVKMSESPNLSRKRNSRCKVCASCLATDCGQCMYCLDKPKFGGPNTKKSACLHRRCMNMVPKKSYKSSVTPQKTS